MNQVTAFSTAMLAALTAWLAYDTHRLVQVTAYQSGLERRVGLVRECDVDTRDDVQARDALIELRANDKDGYEGSDQLSRRDMFTYLKAPTDDYLRCTISNFGKLPLLDVQTVFDADFPGGRKIQIVSTRFHVIAPNESKTTWFANNSKATITIHSPHLIRYRTFDQPDQPTIEKAKPILNDRWVLRSGRDVEEYLDQSETSAFEENSVKTKVPMSISETTSIATALETLILAIVGTFAAIAAWRAANANRVAAGLSSMQLNAMKPYLDFWDRVDEPSDRSTTSVIDAPAVVILRNYGGRPAKMETVRFEIDNLVREATFLTHPVVMPGEFVRLRLPWDSNEMGDAKWGHDLTKSDADGRLRLSFSYTEVDGHNRVEGRLSLPSIATRRRNMKGATIEVLALEDVYHQKKHEPAT